MTSEPTLSETIAAARKAVQGQKDKNADYVRGSDYEILAGSNAIIWTRESRRDTDLFKATRFHDAQGADLTHLVLERYGIERYLDTRGAGLAILTRPTTGTPDMVWAGTRIRLRAVNGLSKYYRATEDKSVAPADGSVAFAIEALDVGPGSKITTTSDAVLEDPLADSAWVVSFLTCEDGTIFEPAADLVDRVRTIRTNSRVGYVQAIIDACKSVGAGQVVAFRSDFGGDANDVGLNVTYVGDSGYVGSADLVKACTVAVRTARVCGDHMQILPMAKVSVNVTADVHLRDAPTNFDVSRLEAIHYPSVRQYLNGKSGNFGYTRVEITSAIARSTPEVQDVTFTSPTTDAGILTVSGGFPAVLNRYVAGDISLRYVYP